MSKINYDLSRIKGVVFDVDGVLSPVCVPMDNKGIPQRMANLRDGYAIQLAVKKGLKLAIISGALQEAIVLRFNNLGVKDVFLTSGPKDEILKGWMNENSLTASETAFVGDDVPDVPCMKEVGLPVAPSDAAIDAKEHAIYITTAKGGYGVARELLEQILKARNQWPLEANANGM